MKHLSDVGMLSHQRHNGLLSAPLQGGICFFRLLTPSTLQKCLAVILTAIKDICPHVLHVRQRRTGVSLLPANELTHDLGFLTLTVARQRTLSSGGISCPCRAIAPRGTTLPLAVLAKAYHFPFSPYSFYGGFYTSSINLTISYYLSP